MAAQWLSPPAPGHPQGDVKETELLSPHEESMDRDTFLEGALSTSALPRQHPRVPSLPQLAEPPSPRKNHPRCKSLERFYKEEIRILLLEDKRLPHVSLRENSVRRT